MSSFNQTVIMDKYMLIFRSPMNQEMAYQEMSPEAIQAEIEKWNTWIGGIAAQGNMHGTEALLPTGKIIKEAGNVITDGPYAESKEIVGGYMLVTAGSLDEAVEMAKGCPIFETKGAVEVRQVQNFEM